MIGLAACSGSGTSPQTVTQDNISANILQLAVGTANIYGDLAASGGNLVGTNIVATYRQAAGSTAPGDSILLNSPTLTGPFKLAVQGVPSGLDALSTIQTGSSFAELGGSSITSTVQGGTNVTSLGTSGSVSGLGLEPFNYNSVNGVPATVVPYAVPLLDPAGDANTFVPWGGPPAFDPHKNGQGLRDGSVVPDGTLGVSEGLDVLAGVAPSTAGAYTLSAPTTGTSAGNVAPASASFTLKTAALLPAVAPAVPTLDALGGGTFAFALPAGVSQAYIQVTDFGPDAAATTQPAGCNTASVGTPVYYTMYVTASGTATLGDVSGPGGAPSICTSAQNTTAAAATTDGDQFTIQVIGFDYPVYAVSYPNSLGNPKPTLLGGAGQDDITISSAATYTQPAGGALTRISSKARRPGATVRKALPKPY